MDNMILLFWQGEPDTFLGSDWLASAVGIAITYVVFVMGIPSLIFQTFIPEAFRYIYNERFSNEWRKFFRNQLILAVSLFLVSDTKIYNSISWVIQLIFPDYLFGSNISTIKKDIADGFVALGVTIAIIIIILQGFKYLIRNFQSTRNIPQQIAEKISKSAIDHFTATQTIPETDLDDLTTLAKELSAGQLKNQFLEECEKIIEFILKHPAANKSSTLINRLLEDVVCKSVIYDGGSSNQENRRKVLQILNLVYGHILNKKNSNQPNDYDKTLIGYYFREVGVAAMNHQDTDSGIEVIEQLYSIDGDPKEIFTIGNQAFKCQNNEISIAAVHNLKSMALHALTQAPAISGKEKRIIYNWLGLLAKIFKKDGAARVYAGMHLQAFYNAIQRFNAVPVDLINDAYKYFFRLADFDTADALHYLGQHLPPEKQV